MGYVALDDLRGRIPPQYLTEGLDDAASGAAEAWEAVLDDAEHTVNAILGLRYTVPFTAPYPPIVVDAARTFACDAVYRRRGVPDEQNPYAALAAESRRTLRAIAEGKLPLAPEISRARPSGTLVSEPAGTHDSRGRRQV